MGEFVKGFFYLFYDVRRFIVFGIDLKCVKEVSDCFENFCGLGKVDITGFY